MVQCDLLNSEDQDSLWTLPSEVSVKIWQMCSLNDRLNMRAVCTKWNHTILNYFPPISEVTSLTVYGNKRISVIGIKDGRMRKFKGGPEGFMRILLRTNLSDKNSNVFTGVLRLSDEAVCQWIFDAILERRWNIRRLELSGEITSITNEQLFAFILEQNRRSTSCKIEFFSICRGIINDNFGLDGFLKDVGKDGLNLDIDLQDICASSLTHGGITDDSLETIFRPNRHISIPFPLTNSITLGALENAVRKFFATDWRIENPSGSRFYDDSTGELIYEKDIQFCVVELGVSTNIHLLAIARLELPGVVRTCFLQKNGRLPMIPMCKCEVQGGTFLENAVNCNPEALEMPGSRGGVEFIVHKDYGRVWLILSII